MADAGDKKRQAEEQKRHQEQMRAFYQAAEKEQAASEQAAKSVGRLEGVVKKLATERQEIAKSALEKMEAAPEGLSKVGEQLHEELKSTMNAMASADTINKKFYKQRLELLNTEIAKSSDEDKALLSEAASLTNQSFNQIMADQKKLSTQAAARIQMVTKPLSETFKKTNLGKIFGATTTLFTGMNKDQRKAAETQRKEFNLSMAEAARAQQKDISANSQAAQEIAQEATEQVAKTVSDAQIGGAVGDQTPESSGDVFGDLQAGIELTAEEVEKSNELLRDGLGIRSAGYLHDIVKFFAGDKLDKVEERREQEKRDTAQLDALEGLAEGDSQGGVVAVEAKGAKGGGLFGGIAAGFQGLLKMLKSIGSFIKDLITGLFDMIAQIMTSIGKGIGGLLKGIAKGLNAFKKESLIGAAAMLIVAGAMFVMAKAMTEFAKTNWKAVAIGLTSLAALAGITFLLGNLSAQVLLGAAGLIVVSGAMFILAKAMNIFNDVDWKAVAVALTTVVSLGLVAAGLGLIAPIALAGAAAMVVIAGAMYIVAQALKVVAQAMNLAIPFFETIGDMIVNVIGAVAGLIEGSINTIVDGIMKLGSLDAGSLVATAGAIALLGGAVAGFGTGAGMGGVLAAGAGLITAGLDWLTGGESDPIENLMRLASIGNDLGTTTENIGLLSAAMGMFSKHMDTDEIGDAMSGAFEALNDAINELDENKIKKKVKALDAVGKSIGNLSATVAGVSMGGDGPVVEMALPQTTQIIRESAADLDAWDLEEMGDERHDMNSRQSWLGGMIENMMPGYKRAKQVMGHSKASVGMKRRASQEIHKYEKFKAEFEANTIEIQRLNEILGDTGLEHLGGKPPVVVVQQNTNSVQGGDKHTTVVPNDVRPRSGVSGEDDL